MSWSGAPLKIAFDTIGEGSKLKPKAKDKLVPRDDEANKLNKINFEKNLQMVMNRYDNIIHKLNTEISNLKNKQNIIEGFKNKDKSNFSGEQIDQLIFCIFVGIFVILTLNYIVDLCKKK